MAHAWVMYFGGTVAAMLAMFGLTYSASVAGFMGAIRTWTRRGRKLPGAIDGGRVVSARSAFATGINAGTNIGALLTPLIVPVLTLTWMEAAFVATGAFDSCVALWWVSYRSLRGTPAVSQGEPAHPERSARADDKDVVGNNPSASPGVDLAVAKVHD